MESQPEEKSRRCDCSFWSCVLYAQVTVHAFLDLQHSKPEIFAFRYKELPSGLLSFGGPLLRCVVHPIVCLFLSHR